VEENIKKFMADMGIDDYEDIASLYQDYIYECNELIDMVECCIHTTTIPELEKIIHNFKGVSGNLYVLPVYELAREIDDLLKSNDDMSIIHQQLLDCWQQVVTLYQQSIDEIKSFFMKQQQIILLSK
jgi:HPt (histidine-containing phosphotransfer) domain-containing protein